MAELLKEAIADAKAVREVALQNAKMALEEAFDSKIKNMLSAKLAEELEEDVELEEEYMEEDEPTSEAMYDEDDNTVGVEFELEEEMDEEINLEELMAELEEMNYDEDDDSEMMEEEVEETNETIDIDALIAEIEAELEEGKEEEDEPVKEVDNAELEEAKRRAKKAEREKEEKEEELKEALATVVSLRESISEMNLLNSKLLYCNKLFKANSLNESQKIKVIDALDKASTTSEAKLVFDTLQESFNFTNIEKRTIKESLGRASKASGISPKNVITESVDETVSRFQKLANIKL